MANITSRQAKILAVIVKEYSQKCRPVGSNDLAGRYDFGVSSATIRSEMQVLEKAGYIVQPHTSAGRVPTNQGYRYFVKKLMKHLELTHKEQHRLQHELSKLQKQYLELGRSLSRLLAEHSGGAAFALLPEHSSTSGLSNVIERDSDPQEIREVARFLDEIADRREEFIKKTADKVTAYVGSEAPVPISKDYSMVVGKISLPDGKKGIVGLVGSKRMKYAKNISLLEYVSKLLSSGLGTYLIINLF